MAKHLRVPHPTVYLRMKTLESDGIIERYVPVLNREKIGKPLLAMVEIKAATEAETGQYERMVSELAKVDGVTDLYSITGNMDGLALVMGRDMADINSAIAKIRAVKGVRDTITNIVLKAYKEHEVVI
jgi:Lrp/AsnC family leucine-responsive transcriptional regulator/Lrp/AsnC family transcriptional regulator